MSIPSVTANPPESLQRLLQEARFVRLLARELLADEADEVVQRTWLAAVRHGGEGVTEPRSWLARIVRNVAQNLRRGRHRRQRHEQHATPIPIVPSSADLLAREEQRAMLLAAVDRLPTTLRTVVLLRYFEGLQPRRIATELGVPVTTVWNRLRQGLQLLRERLDAEHGGQRRAWLLTLVPFAPGTQAMPLAMPAMRAMATSTVVMGAIVMTMKTKLVAAVAALLAVAGALIFLATRDTLPTLGGPAGRGAMQGSVASSEVLRDPVGDPAMPSAATEREAVVAPTAADATGTLVVHVRWGDDKAPAEGVTMMVYSSGGSRWDTLRQATGADGTARFESLAAGRFVIKSNRGWSGERIRDAEIRSGATTALDYELEVGIKLTGSVVDAVGTPVPGALVEVAQTEVSYADAEALAVTGPDGRFVVRGAPTRASVRARAPGHSSPPLQHITGKDGNTAELRIQLGRAGGAVAGIVVDAQHLAVPDAVVCIGRGISPVPTFVRTDGEGRFHAFGIPPGSHPVFARARDKAPWQGTCEVTAHLTTPLQIVLNDGATLRGVVSDAEGAAVADVEVEVGAHTDFAHYRTTANDEGRYELSGLPAGEIKVRASHDVAGRTERLVQTVAGATTPCDLQLSRGTVLTGRVVDEQGKPVVAALLMVRAPRLFGQWVPSSARTDANGRFTVPNCATGERLEVTVAKKGFVELVLADVDPVQGPLAVTLCALPTASVKVTGILTDPAGQPMPNVPVLAIGPARIRECSSITGPDGRFDLGPLPPGIWTFRANSRLFPPWSSGAIPLAAEANLDLGLVSMGAGGTAIVQVEGDRTDVQFLIMDAAAGNSGLTEKGGALVSKTLAPGDYRLRVTGKAVAAESIPFQVRTGQETPVTVKLRPGVRQRFEVVADGAALPQDAVLLIVHRGADLLTQTGVPVRTGEPTAAEVCLSPGDYRVTVMTANAVEIATAVFTVGATEAPLLRLPLR